MKLLLIFLSYSIATNAFAQSIDFVKYNISEVGSILIPANLELQSGVYKKNSENFQKDVIAKLGFDISGDRIVFQQMGLNEYEKKGFSSYVRVIIETNIGSYGDYEKLTNNYTASSQELSEINKLIESQFQKDLIKIGIKIVHWNGVSIVKINGLTALKISYLRQLNDNPIVTVNIFRFQNNDRLHSLTLSCRKSDELIWAPLFTKITKSFSITNVR